MAGTEAPIPEYEFADVVTRRMKARERVARLRILMLPVAWLLRGVFGLSRLLGFEYPLCFQFAQLCSYIKQ